MFYCVLSSTAALSSAELSTLCCQLCVAVNSVLSSTVCCQLCCRQLCCQLRCVVYRVMSSTVCCRLLCFAVYCVLSSTVCCLLCVVVCCVLSSVVCCRQLCFVVNCARCHQLCQLCALVEGMLQKKKSEMVGQCGDLSGFRFSIRCEAFHPALKGSFIFFVAYKLATCFAGSHCLCCYRSITGDLGLPERRGIPVVWRRKKVQN